MLADLDWMWSSELLSFSLALRGDVVVVSGQVASEGAKAAATRALLAYDRVFKIENDLEVTGFFAPAAGDDDEALFAGPADDLASAPGGSPHAPDPALRSGSSAATDHGDAEAAATLVRHPSLDVTGDVLVGGRIAISVDLPAEPPDARIGDPVRLVAEPDWQVMTVDVKIVSGQLEDVEPADGRVLVARDGTTTAAEFTATVSSRAAADGFVRMTVAFMHGTRFCGAAERTVSVEQSLDAPSAQPAAHAAPRPASIVLTPAGGPAMNVNIHSVGSEQLLWHWTTFPPTRAPGFATTGEVGVGNAREFAAGLLSACPGYAPDQARRRLRSIGEQIWNRAPDGFRASYGRLRATLGPGFPIQFISSDPHVPWEMMRPPPQDIPGADHLFLDHPVARWPLKEESMLAAAIPPGRVVSFVPTYTGGATLPAARREQAWLVAELGAEPARALRADFIALMEDGADVGIVHFAGHGGADTGNRDSGLELEDGAVVLDDVLQGGVRLGHACRSLVVLNACEVANQQSALGFVEGWGPGLARQGFGAIIAPLWRVKDEASANFVIAALRGLALDGRALGEAVARARAPIVDRSSTGFAYIAYGDVMARMSGFTR